MNWKATIILIAGLLIFSSPSWAQPDTTGTVESKPAQKEYRLEIIPMGGYVWTVSQSATYNSRGGDMDLKTGGFWGIAVDINAMPGIQGRLLYRRQDTQVTFKSAGTTETLSDVGVEYWHIGGVKAIQLKEKVMPFTSLTLGGTRFVFDNEDDWKFSILLSLGAKIYINEKIGLMVAGQMPVAFTSAFLGIGTGGLSIGGSGIYQFDLVAGLIIRL